MMGKNVTESACALFLVLLISVTGHQPFAHATEEVEDAQAWMTRMEQALGGEMALAELTSLAVSASCSGPGGAFKTEVASLRSEWVWFRQTHDDGTTEVWSSPDRTWTIEASGDVKDLPPGVRSFVRSHEFHFLLFELATRFTGHRMGPTTTVRDQPCVALLMEDEMGQPASICLNSKSRLPVMLELNPEGAAGVIRIYFEDWEAKAGIQFFGAFELTEGSDRTFRYDYDTIEPNVVPAMEFVEPVAQKLREDQRALLDVLENGRRAHLETDVELLVDGLADEVVELSSGMIRFQTRSEIEDMFERVFEGATYQQWEDTEPPRLKLSADGSLAWVARCVSVRRSRVDTDGQTRQSSFVCAYSCTYEKQDGNWKMTSVTSTFLPDESE